MSHCRVCKGEGVDVVKGLCLCCETYLKMVRAEDPAPHLRYLQHLFKLARNNSVRGLGTKYEHD